MRTIILLFTLTVLTGCVTGRAPQTNQPPALMPQESDTFARTEAPARLKRVAQSMSKQYHALSQRVAKGQTLAVSRVSFPSTNDEGTCVARRVFTLFSGELPNMAIRKGIAEPTVLLAGNQIGSRGMTRNASKTLTIRVETEINSSESLHHITYMFITPDGKVLFSVSGAADRNWAEVKQLERQCSAPAPPVPQVQSPPTALMSQQYRWTGCAPTRAEAEAAHRFMGAMEGKTAGNVRAVRTGAGWCVDGE